MTQASHYDTVAFDVRDDAAMLFFADTGKSGDILSYLLLMRTGDPAQPATLCLEINEKQLVGNDIIREANLTSNVLTLHLDPGTAAEVGDAELVLTFDDTAANRAGIEAGALTVLGEKLSGGHS